MSRMTSYIPTLDQIDELHQKIAPSQAAYDLVHMHCVVVATIARQLARHQNALFTNKLGQAAATRLTIPPGQLNKPTCRQTASPVAVCRNA